MNARKRVLVLFPDEWDRAAAGQARHRASHEFVFEGFDLFRFPDNARLFTFDVLRFVERLVRRFQGGGIDAVVTSDEQFGPIVASLVASRLGLPHNPLEAVLLAQHKYHARASFERSIPECNVRHGLISRDFRCTGRAPLPFPFYVKPVKAAYSVLARRVDSFEELDCHARFSWFEQAIIERLVKPFGDVMRAHSNLQIEPFSMLAEELITGHQVTLNGFARRGAVTFLGAVDSIMYPGTDHFQRFEYPSLLQPEVVARLEEATARALGGIGFTHGMFNVEMRVDMVTGALKIIEINPRAAGQFYDLFERVDGFSLFEAHLALDAGEEPAIRRRAGRDSIAASFVLRDFRGEGLSRWPSSSEIRELQARHGDAHVMIYAKRGSDLKREMKWLGSYRYATLNLGAADREAMFRAYHRICADIRFHPPSCSWPRVDDLLAQAASD
jgi:GNAT superfamily N-acetyltransferase